MQKANDDAKEKLTEPAKGLDMKYPRTLSHLAVRAVLMSALLQLQSIEASGQAPPSPEGASQVEADVKACKEQLGRILEAVQRYQTQHQRMPNWFMDLHPQFIADSKTFICPVVRRLNDPRSWREGLKGAVFADPLLPTSYSYEFCMKELQLAPGVRTTHQEYKKRQMSLVGDKVPVVRCFAHDPVLNLSIGGRVYPSGRYWEDELTQVSHEALEPKSLFQDLLKGFINAPRSFPTRRAEAGTELVDLTRHYNFRLNETWLAEDIERGDFANLPQGVVKLEGLNVPFDIRGRIQLNGRNLPMPFPPRVDGIQVNQQCRRLHFLCGTVGRATPGTGIGSLEIHYADGRSNRMEISYGKHVQDWLFDPQKPTRGDAQAAWQGTSPAQGKFVRLYDLQWENPLPEVRIATLDFVSALTAAAPFLIAITLE